MRRLGLRDEDEVSKIVKMRLIAPLGNRSGKQEMLFFADEVEARSHDRRWMEKMVRMLREGEPPAGEKNNATT